LGFHELRRSGRIEFKIRPRNVLSAILYRDFRFYYILKKIAPFLISSKKKSSILSGYYKTSTGRIRFAYDSFDTPFHFDISKLKKVDFYFKAQCPIEINEQGFELAPGVFIKFQPEALQLKRKIYPAMLAPLYECKNLYSYDDLKTQYRGMFYEKICKEKILMAYFGNSKGPKPVYSNDPDLYHEESEILGFFRDKISHPNEKRDIAVKIIKELGEGFEGRIVIDGHSDDGLRQSESPFFIPMDEYPKHISKYKYNLNISGYRNSIPYRFVQSFAVGTAIVTDKLKVKWFKPFNKEVIETIDMGYLPNNDVDWDTFKCLIKNLPDINYEEVLDEFYKKWTPKAFANYVIDTLEKSSSLSPGSLKN
jgi:hypothetical protein